MTDKTSGNQARLKGRRFELEKTDADFPATLLEVPNAPERLYGIGYETALRAGVGIIGARNATPYGKRTAHLVATWAAELGLTVYSGCARGCDQAAHRGALEAGGKTVAIMGCGADMPYPASALKLLERISKDGAVISSYDWGTPPRKYRFRERNRLIAALSCLLVVTEARLPSGTLSAVHHALDLGVPVAAVPGSIFCLESAAPNKLISEGAFPLCCRDDLALACGLATEETRTVTDPLFVLDEDDESEEAKERGMTERICQAVQANPLMLDEIASEVELPFVVAAELVGCLEVQGQIMRFPDGRYGGAR